MSAHRPDVRGSVHHVDDEGFGAAVAPWNAAIVQRPAMVVTAADADDVAAVVRHARATGARVTVQATGHGATGAADGRILLRTGRLDEVRVDPVARTARVGAGATWGDVQAAAGPHGLTALPGSSPVVGVTGYLLGGGLSWFSRRYGWAAESVRAAEIVDAAGDRRRISADTDAELFWAIRGGGGDVAVVTALELELYPAPALYGGRMRWPIERAPEVLAAFRDVTATAPDELTVWVDMLQAPGHPPVVAVDSVHLGDRAEARRLLGPLEEVPGLLGDGRSPLDPSELGGITGEPTEPLPFVARAALLTDLDDDVLKTVAAAWTDTVPVVRLRHLGGALARPSDTAAGSLTEPYLLYLLGVPTTPAAQLDIRTEQAAVVDALAGHLGSRTPYTYLSPGDDAASAFTPEALDRLRAIKHDRDPDHVLTSNVPTVP